MSELAPSLGGPDAADDCTPEFDPPAWEVLSLRTLLGQKMHHAPYLVWPFHEAPPQLQALSTHGGDEDWVVYVPPGHVVGTIERRGIPRWIIATGICDFIEYEIQVGHNTAHVYIGAHA